MANRTVMFHSESGARTEEMGQEPQNGGGKKTRQESGKAGTMNNAGMLRAFIQDPGSEMSGDNA